MSGFGPADRARPHDHVGIVRCPGPTGSRRQMSADRLTVLRWMDLCAEYGYSRAWLFSPADAFGVRSRLLDAAPLPLEGNP